MNTNKFDQNNKEQLMAYELITNTNTSFFLTGKAGTGKTTFLKYVLENVNKKFVVLAPTGIAAINAGGETLHSFFGLPFNAIGPKDHLKLRESKINIIKNTDAFIIDEVSMVRCDVIDAIDKALRRIMYSSIPFGGKQMIFIGDVFQLEPILKTPEDKMLIKDVYNTEKPFFFKAHVFEKLNLSSIEFKINYRQEDDKTFLNILDEIRVGSISSDNLSKLNDRLNYTPKTDEFIVTLTGHNAVADKINEAKLELIKEHLYVYKAEITGKFSGENKPSEMELKLKKGAQIMFTKNDSQGRWANGTLGMISEISDDLIKVTLENEIEYKIDRVKWENMEYSYNPETKSTNQSVVGTFTQYPLKLAWGITIHKSQGLTFDKVILDLRRGVFADGQTYVALSRARSLQGLYLTSEIKNYYVRTGDEVVQFAKEFNDSINIENQIKLNSLTYESLNKKEFDKAALILFEKAYDLYMIDKISDAFDILNSALDFTVCDDNFFDFMSKKQLVDNLNLSNTSLFVNAVFNLYKGNFEIGLQFIGMYLSSTSNNVNALYLQMRLYSMLNKWGEADQLVDKICANEAQVIPKVYFRGGIINHCVLGLSGIGILQTIVEPCPKSIETYILLQQFCREKNLALPENNESTNDIIREFNKTPLNPIFKEVLVSNLNENSIIFDEFRTKLLNEVFE